MPAKVVGAPMSDVAGTSTRSEVSSGAVNTSGAPTGVAMKPNTLSALGGRSANGTVVVVVVGSAEAVDDPGRVVGPASRVGSSPEQPASSPRATRRTTTGASSRDRVRGPVEE